MRPFGLKSFSLAVVASSLLSVSALGAEYLSVARDGINLRSGPNTNSSVLFELPMGYPLEVLGKEGQWLKVSDYGQLSNLLGKLDALPGVSDARRLG